MKLAVLASAALIAAFPSCSSCKQEAPTTSAASDGVLPVHPTPVSPAASFTPLRDLSSVALPQGCSLHAPVVRTLVAGENLRLALAPGAPGELAIAYKTGPEAGSLFAHGIVSHKPDRPPRDITWFPTSAPPLLAASKGKWLGIVEAPAEGSRRQVLLAREEAADELLAAGDQLRAVDFVCAEESCAALTTRVGEVASPGATLFTGSADAPAATWLRTDVPSNQQGTIPLSIAAFDPSTREAAISLAAGPKATLVKCRDGQTHAGGTLDARHGAMDAAVIGGRFVLASVGARIDSQGCTPEGARIVLQSEGGEPHELRVSAPPKSALLRALAKGGVLAWLAPVNCLHPKRFVVFMVLLDDAGAPKGSPMAVADAQGFALSTREQELHLVLDTPDGVVSLGARCTP